MKITLKTLAESEEICDAARGPLEIQESGDCGDFDVCEYADDRPPYEHIHVEYWGIKSPVFDLNGEGHHLSREVAKRIEHSYNVLPTMHELVREMYRSVKYASLGECILREAGHSGCEDHTCTTCRARRLMKQLEKEEQNV